MGSNSRLPLRMMYFFSDVPNGLRSKLVSKLHDLNASTKDHALTTSEFELIVSLAATLENTSRYHASEVSTSEVTAVIQMLEWVPSNLAIPFDLMRMLASHPHGADTLARHSKFKTILPRIVNVISDPSTSLTVSTVMLRFAANCIRNNALMKACILVDDNARNLSDIIEASKNLIAYGNKNFRLSLGSLLANLSITLGDIPLEKCSMISELYLRVKRASRMLFPSDPSKDLVLVSALSIGTLAFHSRRRNILPELLNDLTGIVREFYSFQDSWKDSTPGGEVDETLTELQSLTL